MASKREQLQRAFAAIGGAVDQAIAVRLQRRLADDVVVGEDVALVGDEEARADAGLAVLPLEQRAHLEQVRPGLAVEALRRGRHGSGQCLRGRRFAAAGGWPATNAPHPATRTTAVVPAARSQDA